MTQNHVTIRPAAPEDGAAFRCLLEELGYPVPVEEFTANYLLQLKDQDVLLLAATSGGKVNGLLMGYISRSLTHGNSLVINHLVVTESCRGQGLGRSLVKAAIHWTQVKGLSKLRVGSQTYREQAHRFYEDLGFSRIKTQHWFEYSL